MKTRIIMSLALLLALLTISMPDSIPAQAQQGSIQESFEEPNLPGWELSPQTKVMEGVLRLEPGGFAVCFGDWQELTLSVKLRITGEGRAVIGYNFRDSGRYFLSVGSNELILDREANQSRTSLGTSGYSIEQHTWIHLKIVANQGEHQIFIEDQLQLTVTDPDPLPAGAVMFGVEGQLTAEFDDLTVMGTPAMGQPGGQEAPVQGGQEIPGAQPTPGVSLQTEPAVVSTASAGVLDDFFASQASILDLTTFIINILLAVICAFILGLVYIHWGTSLSNRRKFAANFLLMTVTTTFIILVVRSSVALSLGLVGALSIVRFRTAVKEPEELTYLFVAIGIGIGLGDNQRLVTLVALAAIVILIALRRLFQRQDADVNLHLSVTSRDAGKVELEKIMQVLKPHVSKIRLLRLDESRNMMEAGFLVEFARGEDFIHAKAALLELSQELEITFMDNKGLW